jgi:hypothetical protein
MEMHSLVLNTKFSGVGFMSLLCIYFEYLLYIVHVNFFEFTSMLLHLAGMRWMNTAHLGDQCWWECSSMLWRRVVQEAPRSPLKCMLMTQSATWVTCWHGFTKLCPMKRRTFSCYWRAVIRQVSPLCLIIHYSTFFTQLLVKRKLPKQYIIVYCSVILSYKHILRK